MFDDFDDDNVEKEVEFNNKLIVMPIVSLIGTVFVVLWLWAYDGYSTIYELFSDLLSD